jgi:xylulokinase
MPVNDPKATAIFSGLTSEHDIGDMARAVMEGVAFNLRQLLDITRATGARVDELRLIGGGAQGELWPQIIADVFEKPVGMMASRDGAAVGAALLAATGAGVFASVQEAASACVSVSSVLEPRRETADVYRKAYERFGALYRPR